jgi:hypothetical protein
MSVYMYAGMLSYATVYHTLGIWYTRIMKLYIKQVREYVGLSDDDESILILVGVRQMKVR